MAVAWAAALLVPALCVLRVPELGLLPAAQLFRNPWIDGSFWINVLKFNPLLRLPEFVLGVALGRLFLLRQGEAPPRRPDAAAGAAMAAILLLLAAGRRIPFPLLHDGLLDPLFAAAIFFLAFDRGVLARVLGQPAFLALGDASYSLYILHAPISAWLRLSQLRWPALRVGPVPGFLAYAGLTIAASLAAFRFLEDPLRRRLRGR
ncbi:MAG TPA: acyltransferase family protein, partial [Elusimicrobiota bacterium]|nr:acyltransferase family protein [Elusimicrobiota bacterium]